MSAQRASGILFCYHTIGAMRLEKTALAPACQTRQDESMINRENTEKKSGKNGV